MSNIKDIGLCSFSKDDKFFLDANIWLSVYGPMAHRRKRASIYSRAIRDIQSAGCTVYIDVLIVSEFINAYARWEHKQSASRNDNFKDFRRSSAFAKIAEDIAVNAKRIIKQCQRCDSNFADIDIEALLTEFGKGDSDFNDEVFSTLCKDRGLILVTDDKDFKGFDLAVLTANDCLLRA